MAHSTEQTTTVCMAGPSGSAGGRGAGPAAAPASAEQSMIYMRFGESVSDALGRLYKNPVAAIQEIVANAVAACKAARELHGADAYIRIHACGRNLSIEDRNSMGMSWDVFRNVYARAGSSLKMGRNGASTPGMFGCGSLSYVLVSDIMFLASHSRETGERYEVMACDGRGFQTGLPEPGMDWYGTRVRLTIREGVNMAAVFNRIAAIAGACGVRIVVDMDHVDDSCAIGSRIADMEVDWETAAEAVAEVSDDAAYGEEEAPPGTNSIDRSGGMSGRYVFEASTFSDKVQRMRDRLARHDAAGDTESVCVRAETDDLEVAAFRQCNTDCYGDPAAVCRTYLAGMPIDHAYDARSAAERFTHSTFDRWVVMVHAKNERKYMPTPDRERFPDDTFERLVDDVDRLLIGRLRSIQAATLPEYLSDPSNRAIEPIAVNRTEVGTTYGRERGPINTLNMYNDGTVDERMARLAAAAGPVSITSENEGTTLWDLLYAGASGGGQGARCGRDGRIDEPLLVVCKRPDEGVRKAIMGHVAAERRRNVVVFSPHPRNAMSADDYIALGCEGAAEYIERNGLVVEKAPAKEAPGWQAAESSIRRDRAKVEYVAHCGGRGLSGKRGVCVPILESERVANGSVPSGATSVVRCGDSKSFAAMRGALAALECGRVYATRAKAGMREIVDFDDYADAAGKAPYDTTIGSVDGRELAECGRRVVLVVYDRPECMAADLAALIADARQRSGGGDGGDGAVYVIGRPDRLAACAAHLWRSDAKFGVWMLPYYSRPGVNVLAGKSYLGDMAEHGHSPAEAAPRWVRTAIDRTETGYGHDPRNDAMEMLHACLEGAAALRTAGIEYDGDAEDDDHDDDGDGDDDAEAEG